MTSPAPLTGSASLPSMSGREEWRRGWLLVFAALAGMTFGTIPTATMGLFMEPLGLEFGWSRTKVSAGLTVFALLSLPLTPFAGVLVDRVGPRRVGIAGMALSGLIFAAFGLIDGQYWQWLAIWVLYTLASLLTRSLVWNSAVSAAFTASRGLAIAVLLCGSAVAQSLSPIYLRWLIDGWGWRAGFFGLGLGWGGVVLVLLVLFFRERPHIAPLSGEPAFAPEPPKTGLTTKQALGSMIIRRIAFAMFLQALIGAAVMVHLVPLLTAGGTSRGAAVGLAALIGLGAIAGKLTSGWLADRIGASALPAIIFALPALGYAMIWQGAGNTALLSAAIPLIGFASGASLQQTIYLTTRYAGLRNFGTIFGFISSFMALAGGLGPLLGGVIFDQTGGYDPLLIAGVAAALLAGLSVLRLGPYPEFANQPPEPE